MIALATRNAHGDIWGIVAMVLSITVAVALVLTAYLLSKGKDLEQEKPWRILTVISSGVLGAWVGVFSLIAPMW